MVHQVKNRAELKDKFAEAGTKLVVIDFFATWCGPCKRVAPFFEKLSEEFADKMVSLKVDVDEIEELVEEYSVDVMPTFVFVRNGEHLDSLTGSNESKLRELVVKHLGA